MSEQFRPGLLVRSGHDGSHRVGQRRIVATGTLVRVALSAILVVLWALSIATGLSQRYTDPLQAYWASLSTSQKVTNCNTWAVYPRYVQNTLVGAVDSQVSAEESADFLRSECG